MLFSVASAVQGPHGSVDDGMLDMYCPCSSENISGKALLFHS